MLKNVSKQKVSCYNCDMKTQILYEDQAIIVCHKPAGLATQSASVSQPDVESELKNYIRGGELHVVHRLDQPVEGILVFARNRKAAAQLGAQVQDGRMKKVYHAFACGRVEQGEIVLINDLVKLKNGLGHVVTETEKNQTQYRDAKRAELVYHGMGYDSDTNVSKVEIQLKTGRFHQIRLQMNHAGFPLVGDLKYGGAVAKEAAVRLQLRYLALAACKLEFEHPESQKNVRYEIVPAFER